MEGHESRDIRVEINQAVPSAPSEASVFGAVDSCVAA